mmetsp:Transcript_59124/g.70537  ORF Transcript_59124/g.70537 Transcript_59124/m.70537 type:complete len:908 (+) Transcript_59124:70-2793(+)|eukprot:CAMPEP_0172502020 /NCGR_PEP_ID=MMETSP1066-20121228/155786_1 /TAXON_ID=671091 /ORGANISM="Coscinodiscus wailesii, Strain CCMP2513" /LENGTH=907 /DNA_ID=CAMNT_0013277121 /DNA_START=68 /DNA_END=2791 /DNA_ORIENTATION=-
MPQTVLVGKNRRLTISELLSVSISETGTVQFHDQNTTSNDSDTALNNDSIAPVVFPAPAHGSDEKSNVLSRPISLATLALLSLHTAQNPKLTNSVTLPLLKTLSCSSSVELPAEVSAWPESLSCLSCASRCLSLARGAIAVGMARELILKAADPIAALTVQRRLGCGGSGIVSQFFGDSFFDGARPHRGIVASATELRAILEGGRFSPDKALTSLEEGSVASASTMRYTKLVPQYHGAARDALQSAYKTIELELNCFEAGVEIEMTLAGMALSEALNAVISVLDGSRCRQGLEPKPQRQPYEVISDWTDVSAVLYDTVMELRSSLETEAKESVTILVKEMEAVEREAKEKEEAKAARQQQGDGMPQKKDNEFEGKTEAQIAKILKKRAAKEKKASAKKSKTKSPTAGLFGQGIKPLIDTLGSNPSLNASVLNKISEITSFLLLGGQQRKPKIPKGTRDYLPEQMQIRDQAFQIIRRVFKSHGAVEIDTPVFELKDTLTGKYGEDSKLIYDLADQGGELLALRYDLTVPFARFLALNRVGNIKRFHIGKVYRRDQPALARGRYREFYQCDFDIAGVYNRMVPDAECLCVAVEILANLDIGDFGIKLNHRRLLDAILDLCGVPSDKFRTICSAVDKLDKEPWSEVKREMVQDKGLDPDVADRIGKFVLQKGKPKEMYETLMAAKQFGNHEGANQAMEDLKILFDYLEAMGKLDYISFDLSLARGLDYYTGVIYEAVCLEGNTQVGSIGGGGRYDNLVSMFQDAGKVTPCVGVSVGIERVFTLMEARLRQKQGHIKQPNVSIIVVSRGKEMLLQRMKVTKLLWDANLSSEFSQKENNNLKYEIANALERDIPFMVILKEETYDSDGTCEVKDLKKETQDTIALTDLVKVLRNKGVVPVGCEFAVKLMEQS